MLSLDPRDWFSSPWSGWALVAVLAVWWGTEACYQRLGRDAGAHVCDRGSRLIANLSVYLGMGLIFLVRGLGWGAVAPAVQYVGLALMVIGIVFRAWAIRVLGRHFSYEVAIQTNHRLVTAGPYRWLRHPCYTGTFLTVVGLALALGTWAAAIAVAILFIVGHSYRIRVEEAAMAETFGAAYEAYRAETWRLFPGW